MDENTRKLLVGSLIGITVAATLIYIVNKSNSNKNINATAPKAPELGLLASIEMGLQTRSGRLTYFLDDMHRKLGKVFQVRNTPLGDLHFVADADEIHRILTNNVDFPRTSLARGGFKGVAENALFVIPSGDEWYRHRKLLSPGFTQNHLNQGFDEAISSANELFDYWLSLNGKPVNAHYHMSCLALDVIGKVIFSQDLDAIDAVKRGDKPERYNLFTEMGEMYTKRRSLPRFLWSWYGVGEKEHSRMCLGLRNLAKEVIMKKKADEKVRENRHMDVLDRLLAKTPDGTDRFTDEEIIDETLGFYFAGHETTANTITLAMYMITQHTDVKAKLIQELDDVLGGKPPTVLDLLKLQYLEQFIKELQRMWPVATIIPRAPVEDTIISGCMVPKDCAMFMNIYSLHRAPWVWGSDSDEFKPDRWSNPKSLPKFGFIPFGTGPTVCIGQRVALLELKAVLVTMLQRLDFTLVESQNLTPVTSMTLGFHNGLFIRATPRV